VLHIHRAERADRLADALGDLLRTPLADPFTSEVVAVPARGVERWLVQRLSHVLGAEMRVGVAAGSGAGAGDGICSGVEFPATAALLATATSREDDPWDADRLVWPVLDVLDECIGEPWCALLAEHLGAAADVAATPQTAAADLSGASPWRADVGPAPGGQAAAGRGVVAGPGVAGGHRRGRRWSTAAHLAALFTAYGADRPQLVRDWAAGRDTDGTRALPGDLAWQPRLWRRLRERLGPSPGERLQEVCAGLRADPQATDLPERVSLFGPTRLSSEQVAVLGALAVHRDVHLWLPHPSPVLWATVAHDLADGTARAPVGDTAGGRVPGRRRDDPTRDAPRNPLLASLGRDVRELQTVLAAAAPGALDEHLPAVGPASPTTLLGRVQADVRDDRVPDGRHVLAPADASVQVHACHGPARQVEVLREVLVGLFQDDPTLEPRDVLVMCPDIETHAPLVAAAFGLADGEHPGHRLQVRLADRSLRRTNPLLDVVARLLDLADGRVTASAVLDLAAADPVRARFGFDEEDLERLRGWVAAVGTRWGLDREHRARAGVDLPQGTWQTGLDRLLLGVTASEDGWHFLGLALPLDDVDSSDVDLAGRFSELVDRLEQTLDALVEQPAQGWADALGAGLELLTDVPDGEDWQLGQARWELAHAAADATTPIGLADARAMLAERLRGRPTRANFRTGRLTVATLVPMRSVPHRVVALLGLDDGVFPRVAAVDGDDLLQRDPRVGERDRRSEDRQLLLDAVLAAQEHLVVLYTGADPLTGQLRPPAVPIGELLDVLDATCAPSTATAAAAGAGDRSARSRIVRRHPLQPFDRRDFQGVPFSFDRTALAGAQRALGERHAPPPFLTTPLPRPSWAREPPPGQSTAAPPTAATATATAPTRTASAPRVVAEPVSSSGARSGAGDVELDDLVAFLEHPVKAFLRQRLGVGVPGAGGEVPDALAIGLDALQTWDVGERLLRARLSGIDEAAVTAAEWRRGTLPPGPLGASVLAAVGSRVDDLVAESGDQVAARTVDVRVDLGGGRLLTGTVPDVHARTVRRTTYSRLSARHRLRAWAQLLALACSKHPAGASTGDDLADTTTGDDPAGTPTAATEPLPWEGLVIGRGARAPATATLTAPPDPLAVLRGLVELRDAGLCEPLPLPTAAAYTYAVARHTGDSVAHAVDAVGKDWTRDAGGEWEDPHLEVVWGARPPLSLLLAEPGRDEPSRFGDLARALWAPLLGAET